jgi:hypothetical protein
MCGAEPHRDAVGEVQLPPLALAPTHAQQARRPVPQSLPLVEAPRHAGILARPRVPRQHRERTRGARRRAAGRAIDRRRTAKWDASRSPGESGQSARGLTRAAPRSRGRAPVRPTTHGPFGPVEAGRPALLGARRPASEPGSTASPGAIRPRPNGPIGQPCNGQLANPTDAPRPRYHHPRRRSRPRGPGNPVRNPELTRSGRGVRDDGTPLGPGGLGRPSSRSHPSPKTCRLRASGRPRRADNRGPATRAARTRSG